MHYRRIVCFLLGVWLGGGILMAWYGARSFGTVETIMNQSNPAFVVQTKPLGPAATRMVLRYVVAEQNRWLFRNWEYMQIALGVAVFLLPVVRHHGRQVLPRQSCSRCWPLP